VSLIDEPARAIHRIAVPTPFAVGPVNCYVISGEPLTLIDTGPNSGSSLDHIERALAELSLRVEDLELIVLTHQHMDHEGLLGILSRRSGAEVAAFHALSPWLADFPKQTAEDDSFVQRLMRRHGVGEDVITVLAVLGAGMRAYGSCGAVTQPLHDGEMLVMGGRAFSVHHRPGHSASDLIFLDADAAVTVGGDHLLSHISSNALVSRPLGASPDAPRPKPLLDYSRSMRATRAMATGLVLPGHGEPISDHVELIDGRLRDQERRARKIRQLLTPEPLSAHALAVQMWGRVALTQAYLTLSEVLGHLDLLLRDGTVAETDDDGLSLFAVI
jgi:glyoxylase-like metal-dependent hydrolase (beta-lactamase superfamily II)